MAPFHSNPASQLASYTTVTFYLLWQEVTPLRDLVVAPHRHVAKKDYKEKSTSDPNTTRRVSDTTQVNDTNSSVMGLGYWSNAPTGLIWKLLQFSPTSTT